MSTMSAPRARRQPSTAPVTSTSSARVLDEAFLALLSWSWEQRVVVFPREHRLLGWTACRVEGCGKHTWTRIRLCASCTNRWQRTDTDLEHFVATATRQRRYAGRDLCLVVGCERPFVGTRGLCQAHKSQHVSSGLSVEEFLADPGLTPKQRLGRCRVAACPRDRTGAGELCAAHRNQRKLARSRPGFDETHWLRTAPAISEDNKVSLLGLSDQTVEELLLGLQGRTQHEVKTNFTTFRGLVNQLHGIEANSLRDLAPDGLPRCVRAMRNTFVEILDRLGFDPLAAWASDRWVLDPMGHRGTLRFDAITQSWLREATKRWAFDELPHRRGHGVTSTMQHHIYGLARFSASLSRHRDDGGEDPRSLSRSDIVDMPNWLAYLQTTGAISAYARNNECAHLAKILRRMRAMGLTRAGEPLAGLPDDVTLERSDIPARRDDDEAGRDLPPEVVSALVAHLPALEATSIEVRVAIELLIDTGRRPSEITNLPLNCLTRDSDNKPVLLWNNTKNHRYGRRLPITEATARVIVDQQDRVRARHPDTAPDELVLLPGRNRNQHGTRPITHNWLADCHRDWVDSLPELHAQVSVVDDAGRTVTRALMFDKKAVVPYSYRHTYCQRHADAGVPVDVLADLMDHVSMSTTQGYYRITEVRRRDAVDRVTSMQFDRHGNRTWRRAQTLLEDERARRGVSEVAVPYGLCTEPTNVAAGGGDCPIRFRCVGCDHFTTDVSYLPDLEAYLADLLRNRERLRALTTADPWATAEAAPSDEEINRIRILVRRVKADIDDLDPDARADIQAAVSAVRRARHGAVGLGMPRIRPASTDIRPEPQS